MYRTREKPVCASPIITKCRPVRRRRWSPDTSDPSAGPAGSACRVCRARYEIFEGREELQVTAIGGGQKLAQGGQAVDGFLHGGPLGLAVAVAVFYLAVVLEEVLVVDRGFDAQDETELVAELERTRPHGVLNARAFDAHVKAVAHLALIADVQFAPQESGDVIGLDGVDGGAAEVLIQGLMVGLFAEDDVGRGFALVHASVIADAQTAMHRTEATGELIQLAMQFLDAQLVGQQLRPLPVGDAGEDVIHHSEIDLQFAQPRSQPLVPVELDLQTAGQQASDETEHRRLLLDIHLRCQRSL